MELDNLNYEQIKHVYEEFFDDDSHYVEIAEHNDAVAIVLEFFENNDTCLNVFDNKAEARDYLLDDLTRNFSNDEHYAKQINNILEDMKDE